MTCIRDMAVILKKVGSFEAQTGRRYEEDCIGYANS